MHIHKFELHVLAHLKIERAQRLVQKQHFGFVDQSARNCHTLLLSAAEGGDVSVSVVFKVNHFERVVDLLLDFRFGVLSEKLNGFALLVGLRAVGNDFEFEPERYVAENAQMRE